ncbi:MAG: hypothetical protein EKK54_08045 [Neisseriaceae bacterium]|nr:MAG: hypothetical protein EKK54_08045 [Neisseriaceae bacterium]
MEYLIAIALIIQVVLAVTIDAWPYWPIINKLPDPIGKIIVIAVLPVIIVYILGKIFHVENIDKEIINVGILYLVISIFGIIIKLTTKKPK